MVIKIQSLAFVLLMIMLFSNVVSGQDGLDLLIGGIGQNKEDQKNIQEFANSIGAKYVPTYLGDWFLVGLPAVEDATPNYLGQLKKDPNSPGGYISTVELDDFSQQAIKNYKPTLINGLSNPLLNNGIRYDTIYAHSGGTRTAVTALLYQKVSANTLVLISPIQGADFMDLGKYKWELTQLFLNKKVNQIIIYQSPVDNLPLGKGFYQAKLDKDNPGIEGDVTVIELDQYEDLRGKKDWDAHVQMWYTVLDTSLGSSPKPSETFLSNLFKPFQSRPTPITSETPKSSNIDIVSIDASKFPDNKITIFVDTPCGKSGNLALGDFTIREADSDVLNKKVSFRELGVDFIVVFDDTGSMGEEIDAMKSKVQDLVDQIKSTGINARYSLISFKDYVTIRTEQTNDPESFKNAISSLSADSGDDEPEVSLDAIESALSQPSRENTQKIILVITDAPAHQSGDGTAFSKYTKEDLRRDLVSSGATLIVTSPALNMDNYAVNTDLRELANDVSGTWIDINSADYSSILTKIIDILVGNYVVEYTTNNVDKSIRPVTVKINKPNCAEGEATEIVRPSGSFGPNFETIHIDSGTWAKIEKYQEGGSTKGIAKIYWDQNPLKALLVAFNSIPIFHETYMDKVRQYAEKNMGIDVSEPKSANDRDLLTKVFSSNPATIILTTGADPSRIAGDDLESTTTVLPSTTVESHDTPTSETISGDSSKSTEKGTKTTDTDTKTAYTQDGINFISKERVDENIKAGIAKSGDYREVQVSLDTIVVGGSTIPG